MPIKSYNRTKSVEYAHTWALARNPRYYDFDSIGGDCTNFASQVIFAGSSVMNFAYTYGWYYVNLNNRSPSWTGVPFLYNFLTKNTGNGPFAKEVDISEVMPGDLVQLLFDGDVFQHSPVIVETGSPPQIDNILVAAHTYDVDYNPLTNYTPEKIRFIHIEGVRY